MYERFSDRGLKAMRLADQEANRLGHEYIGTEHILLALAKTEPCTAAKVLVNLRVIPQTLAAEVEKFLQPGSAAPPVIPTRLPHTPRAKKVIESSIDEARNLNHNYVGTEHLLLGLLRENGAVAGQVLENLGLTLDGVREEVRRVLGDPEIHAVGTALNPAKTEGFALLPEEEDDPAPAAVNVSDVEAAVAFLRGQKDAAVVIDSTEHAARLRAMEFAVSGLLAWYQANGGS